MSLKILRKIIIAAACAFTLSSVTIALSGTAIAADSAGNQQKADKRELGLDVTAIQMLGANPDENERITDGWRVSKSLKIDVYNDVNEKIGQIDDFIVSPDGTRATAIVEVGQFLGQGKYLVAIPVRKFSRIYPAAVMPGATKPALKKLPRFEYAVPIDKK